MTISAMKQALEALGWYCRDTHQAAITALRQAIAEAEKQERVDETAKREHEWVGLTDEEILKLWGSYFPRAMEFYQAIEAKLKGKNT